MILLPMVASAHDIEVQNADGVTIYYNYINDGTELEVTFRGSKFSDYSYEYQGNVAIPEEVTYMNRTRKVTSIGDWAFANCSGLTSITIPNSVTSIGSEAFYYCKGLTSVTIGNSVTSIGDWAFANCSGLTSITIPNSVTSIGSSAFSGCSGLTSVTIPNSVTSIGDYAFSGCSAPTSVTIPNSVTSIGNNAFAHCTNLTDFYCYAESVPTTNSNAFSYSPIENATLHVPAGAVNAYKAAIPWSNFKEIVALTNDDPQPTEIDKIVVTDSNKGVFYDLNGRRVDNPSKGLYIKNGKKYVVK